jgi:hypothetical protein
VDYVYEVLSNEKYGRRDENYGRRMRTTYKVSFTKRKMVNSSNREMRVSRQVSGSESDVMALSGS